MPAPPGGEHQAIDRVGAAGLLAAQPAVQLQDGLGGGVIRASPLDVGQEVGKIGTHHD